MNAESGAIPPVIPTRRSLAAPMAMLLAVGAVAAAKLSEGLNLAALQCGFLKTTGIPCPFCGGTRSLRAVAAGDFMAAFLWNPLVVVGLVFISACGLFSLIRPAESDIFRRFEPRAPQIIITTIVINWAFVIVRFATGG